MPFAQVYPAPLLKTVRFCGVPVAHAVRDTKDD
jgi:hypothetical protein